PLHAPEQRSNASEQLIDAKRLYEIIIRARIESAHAIAHLAFGSEHEHRCGVAEAAQFRAEGEAVEPRHHHIEENEVGFLLQRAFQSTLAVRRCENAEAFAREAILQSRAH